MSIERGTLTVLVLLVLECFGKEFHKHMAKKTANKTGERCEKKISIIKCTLSFLILRSFSMRIRGSSSL